MVNEHIIITLIERYREQCLEQSLMFKEKGNHEASYHRSGEAHAYKVVIDLLTKAKR